MQNYTKRDLLLAVFLGSEDPRLEGAAATVREELRKSGVSAYDYCWYLDPCREVHVAVDWYIRGGEGRPDPNLSSLMGDTPIWATDTTSGNTSNTDRCLYCGTDCTDLRQGFNCHQCGGN